jgi:diguanylate cyclase (GGDEF)-like protein
MDRKVDAAWVESAQAQEPFGLLMLDIDNFKKYNDHYGHQNGDDCLRSVAHAIDNAVHAANAEGLTCNAFAARYGGEEFAVTAPNCTKEALQGLAQAIVHSVHALGIPHEKNNEWGVTTISVGANWLAQTEGEIKQLFRDADAKLYQAKELGRNRAEI